MPLSLMSWQDVMRAVFKDRAVVLATYGDRVVRTANMEIPLPSVIALKQYARGQQHRPHFTRQNVYTRDEYCCQYCGDRFRSSDLSFDHLMPVSLGGTTKWSNVVTACLACNNRKGSTPPQELHTIGMKLQRQPTAPSVKELQAKARKLRPGHLQQHESWKDYLGQW